MNGFFPDMFAEEESHSPAQCESCGLYKECHSPKMPIYGSGKYQILVIGDCPGKPDDSNGIPFSGEAGQFLRSNFPVPLSECWATNAIRCYSGKASPGKEIEYCRSLLQQTIRELKPRLIITLGTLAWESLMDPYISGRLSGISTTAFFGNLIPFPTLNAWIFPTFLPSYVLVNSRDPVLYRQWSEGIAGAVEKYTQDFPVVEESIIKILRDPIQISDALDRAMKQEEIVFDFETTGLKPHREGHGIRTVSIAWEGECYSFELNLVDRKLVERWKKLMGEKLPAKIAHNLPFEWSWEKECGWGDEITSWAWDTCLAAHCINNKTATGLKFQAFIHFGKIQMEDEIKGYLKCSKEQSDTYGSNGFNTILEAPLLPLLKYNALDSLYTWELYKIQKRFLRGSQLQAFKFFLAGAQSLSRIQAEGMHVDVEEIKSIQEHITARMNKLLKKIQAEPEYQRWDGASPLNIASQPQLVKLFYRILKYSEPAGAKTNEDALLATRSPLAEKILQHRKLGKLRDYLSNYAREQIEGIIHPFFSLNRVATFRSSSDSPNFQNIPKRDKEAKILIRSVFRPSPGNMIVEFDYKAVEVCIGACVHQDPAMIRYIEDPSTDMHRDIAQELFFREPGAVSKQERYCGKNGFIFPQFYGSNFEACTPNIWGMLEEGTLEHLKSKGIHSLGKIKKDVDGKVISTTGFYAHVRDIEKDFWGKRFQKYQQWKWDIWKEYKRIGFVQLKTGFRCYGTMRFTEATNYPIQGTAFHCLLWTLNKVAPVIKSLSGRSRIIGQVHDSLIGDIHPEEFETVCQLVREWGTVKIRQEWSWIIVPLTIEIEASAIDGNWAEMKEVKK